MPLSFLQVWKALIISPQLRSQPLVTGSKIMNGFYRMLVICASCSQKPGDLDWLRGHYELSPLSPIFPKLKTYRPAWLKDVKQMLFADICIPKIFFPLAQKCGQCKYWILFLLLSQVWTRNGDLKKQKENTRLCGSRNHIFNSNLML